MTIKKNWTGRLILELVTISLGVYLAFELNRYQEGKRADKIKYNYFTSFKSELTKLGSEITGEQNKIKKLINELTEGLEKGERPALKPVNLYLDAAMLITRAGFNDDVFMQLSPGLASSLSGGFDNVKAVSKKIEYFNILCNNNLISSSKINFYSKDGKLKSEFDWYLAGLKDLSLRLDKVSNEINEQALPYTLQLIKDME
jgi:hypothetical protein